MIELNGEELAAIIAFVHDPKEQARLSNADIPDNVEAMMGYMEGDAAHKDSEEQHD